MEEETTLLKVTSSPSPCSLNDARAEDCADDTVQEWLENEAFPGFRVWQLAGIVLSILLSILIGLCCCVRFRVPRTKQEIEADYIRKRITRSFRNELAKISNAEMDEMDLQKALDRIRSASDGTAITKHRSTEASQRDPQHGFRSRFNAVFSGMRVHFSQHERGELGGDDPCDIKF